MSESVTTGRYYNANGFAVAIVAVANSFDGRLFDWAAYVAGTDRTFHEEDAVAFAVEYGAKLSTEDAAHFFPELPVDLYRP